MSITATALGNLLGIGADYNYYIQQQIYWTNKYDANSAKLEGQVRYYTKWESAMDSATDCTRTRELKVGNFVVGAEDYSEATARKYADLKVSQYSEELSLELADLDIEYDTMKTMYDTLIEELSAQKEAGEQLVSKCAQDTGLLNQ